MDVRRQLQDLGEVFLSVGRENPYRSTNVFVVEEKASGRPSVSTAPRSEGEPYVTTFSVNLNRVEAAWKFLGVQSLSGAIVLDAVLIETIPILGLLYRVTVAARHGLGSRVEQLFAVQTRGTFVTAGSEKLARKRAWDYAEGVGEVDWNATDIWIESWGENAFDITDVRLGKDKKRRPMVALFGRAKRRLKPKNGPIHHIVRSSVQWIQQADDGRWAMACNYSGLDSYYRWRAEEARKLLPPPIPAEDLEAFVM